MERGSNTSIVTPSHHRQSVLIAILVRVGALPNSWKKYDMEDVALGLQNFLICIEMLFAAVAHYFVFSHKPYVDPAAAQLPCFTSCLRMLDVRDVYGDVKTHFVDPIPRPSIPGGWSKGWGKGWSMEWSRGRARDGERGGAWGGGRYCLGCIGLVRIK